MAHEHDVSEVGVSSSSSRSSAYPCNESYVPRSYADRSEPAGSDVVEQHDGMRVDESGDHVPPHLPAASVAVREHRGTPGREADDRDVGARQDVVFRRGEGIDGLLVCSTPRSG
jgi:hypothetical protein